MPIIEFSKWYRWSERHLIENIDLPGIYLLAKFNQKVPNDSADPLDKKIIYIGETCRSLKQRWKEFNNSAFHKTVGHSGGWSYNDKIGDNGENLFVAAMPVRNMFKSEIIRNNFIRYVERKLIWEFSERVSEDKLLNIK